MKISKLFHWLYAVLMLLPVAFIAVRCGYVMFNKNAKDSYSDSRITAITKLDNQNSFQEGLTYYVVSKPNSLNWSNYYRYSYISINLSAYPTATNFRIEDARTGQYWLDFYDDSNTSLVRFKWGSPNNDNDINDFYFTFLSSNTNNVSLVDIANVYYYYTENNPLDNAFEYSVNQLNEVPLFSWAQTSFLIAPFSYITGLFGLASTSPINTLLSYWLSISIIWLVFDLVMYLPLLIHRWLDKGVLE